MNGGFLLSIVKYVNPVCFKLNNVTIIWAFPRRKLLDSSEFNYRMIINLIKIGDMLCYYQNEIVRSIIRSTFQAACLTINEKVNRISDIIQEKPFFPPDNQ